MNEKIITLVATFYNEMSQNKIWNRIWNNKMVLWNDMHMTALQFSKDEKNQHYFSTIFLYLIQFEKFKISH